MSALVDKGRSIGDKLRNVPGLRNPKVRKALLWIAVILVLALAVWLLLRAWSAMSPLARQLFVLFLAIAIVAWWFLKALPWLERRQNLRRVRGDLAPGSAQDDDEPRRQMSRALLQIKQKIPHAEVDRKRDPLYAIPWILFLGDRSSAGTELLSIANTTSPSPPPLRSDSAQQYWHWWLFQRMVAIEADPRFVCDADDRMTRGVWYHALQLLGLERRHMPLNGIVVLVAADKLMGDQEELRRYALNLRRLVDESLEHLQVIAPMYLVVTGCERLPGFDAFAQMLPLNTLRQALGHRIIDASRVSAANWQELPAIFAKIRDRLHAIRISGLRMEPDPKKRKGIWDFVEAFGNLGAGLSLVVKLLLEDNFYERTPQWRGLYFTGTAGKGAFVEDLFTRFFPA